MKKFFLGMLTLFSFSLCAQQTSKKTVSTKKTRVATKAVTPTPTKPKTGKMPMVKPTRGRVELPVDTFGDSKLHFGAPSDFEELVSPKDTTDNTVYSYTEVMPEYPGGLSEMYKFISKNLEYPACATCEGTVFLKFIVEKTGKITSLKVYKDVGACPLLTEEALRVVKLFPDFKPGKMNGGLVRTSCIIPIRFKSQ